MGTLTVERDRVAPASGGSDSLRRGAERGTLAFAEKLKAFIAAAPQGVPLTDEEIMAEIRQVRRDAKMSKARHF